MLITITGAFLVGCLVGIGGCVLIRYVRSRAVKHQDLESDDQEYQPLLRAELRPPLTGAAGASSSTASTLFLDLDPLQFEIRLMCLRGAPAGSKLECDLALHSLSSKATTPAYEALSYVWAEVEGEEVMRVDDLQHTITANLAIALAQLRYEDRDRMLWVDAICINQENVIERGHQVKLMGMLYARATKTLIWLGPESQDSAQAIEDLEQLSQDKHLSEVPFYGDHSGPSDAWLPAPTERITPLENMLKRSYWSRTWVVQEIVNAREATVFCGSSSISWEKCERVRDNWPKHSRQCCNFECNAMDARTRRVMNWINSSWKRYQDQDGDLLGRLSLTRGLHAKLEHDKIYGALGLVHDQTCFLDPDYQATWQSVFRDWTANMIIDAGNLDVFLHTENSSREQSLPSWVPDWTKYRSSLRFQAERLEHHRHISRSFNAAGSSNLRSTLRQEGDILHLAGFPLDVVHRHGEPLAYDRKADLTDDQNQINAIKTWNAVLESWSEVTESAGPADMMYPGGGTYRDAYWRTLLSDHLTEVGTYLGERVSELDETRYRGWSQWFHDLVRKPDTCKTTFYRDTLASQRDLDRFDWTIMNMNYNRKLFSTSNGYVGMGPADMRQGDTVLLLSGGRTPFVAREAEALGSAQNKSWHLIGYAYVHGLMDGEAAPKSDEWVRYMFS